MTNMVYRLYKLREEPTCSIPMITLMGAEVNCICDEDTRVQITLGNKHHYQWILVENGFNIFFTYSHMFTNSLQSEKKNEINVKINSGS